MFNRRSMLAASATLGASLFVPTIAFARVATDNRLVFIIQRGAADGLATLAPVGDPAYAGLRGDLAAEFASLPRLGGMFALHPALKEVGAMYGKGQALFVHAAASPYRDRSHFDGQNVLETGAKVPYDLKDGWMNRLIGLLPPGEARALAIASTIPPALRGPAPVESYAPSALPQASDDLMQRIAMLYAGDAQLHALWEEAAQTRAMAGDLTLDKGRGAAATGKLAASLMTGREGARLVMMETTGWDTHSGQIGRLGAQLTGLDALLAALREGLGEAWNDTLVIVATEFGRTAAVNGTGGTDHGTASLAMLMGGVVKGGRIIADWPGLSPAQLYEGRDLNATSALDAVIAGAVAGQFALDPLVAMQRLFPGSRERPYEGLVQA
jgi:uncharacterized protein (DUF1501 family)